MNKQKQYHKDRYKRLKEKLLADNKAWREANPEREKARCKAYYKKNRLKILARNKKRKLEVKHAELQKTKTK